MSVNNAAWYDGTTIKGYIYHLLHKDMNEIWMKHDISSHVNSRKSHDTM